MTEPVALTGVVSAVPQLRVEWNPPLERDPLVVEIVETGWKPWHEWAKYHHYLKDAGQMPFSTAYTGFDVSSGDPVAFVGLSGMTAGPGNRVARACRLVTHPEYQGAGVGLRVLEAIATREARGVGFIGKPVPTYIHTAHPALCAALRRSPRWRQVSQKIAGNAGSNITVGTTGRYGGHTRSVAGFKFLGIKESK